MIIFLSNIDELQKQYSNSYSNIADEDLENEVYKRAMKNYEWSTGWKNRTSLYKFLKGDRGGLSCELRSLYNGKSDWQNYKDIMLEKRVNSMNSDKFKGILKKEFEEAYRDRPHLLNQQ